MCAPPVTARPRRANENQPRRAWSGQRERFGEFGSVEVQEWDQQHGAQSVSGSGSGSDMTDLFMETARQIVALGVEDPDLFVAMALFGDGFGPDRISDMTANVIFGDLLRFNACVLAGLPVPRRATTLRLRTLSTRRASPCRASTGGIRRRGRRMRFGDLPVTAGQGVRMYAVRVAGLSRPRRSEDEPALPRRRTRGTRVRRSAPALRAPLPRRSAPRCP